MAAKNISKVYLLSVPLENDYKHTLYFTSKETQQEFFASKVVKSYTEFSYQRKDNSIRVPENYDTIYNCNYVMYQNSAYSNKWFYAFIKELKFINDEVTEVIIETDVIQTWFFDYTIKPSFVEREHVSDDTIGLHTIPEGLETGEYIVKSQVDSKIGKAHLVIASTWDPLEERECSGFINGIYHGVGYFLIKEQASLVNTELTIKSFLGSLSKQGKLDAVTGMFMVPDTLTNYNNIEWDSFEDSSTDLIYTQLKKISLNFATSTNLGDMVIQKETTDINGYKPRNRKLFTYPFQYLLCSNNSGSAGIFKYEYFSASPFSFGIEGAISPGCSIRTYPKYYKGIAMNNEEGINGGKYPVCSYNVDTYTNWLTQNAVNIGVGLASSGLQALGGIGMAASGTSGSGSMVLGGVLGIASTLGQVYQQSLVPPQAQGNINCGDVTYGMGKTEFTFYKMEIKKEYAQIIDKYFDMFGYKVNIVKTPNKAHRGRYWYTKTIDINIDGSIPMDDMQKIKNAYNNGITFWRNASEIQNYELTNNIV